MNIISPQMKQVEVLLLTYDRASRSLQTTMSLAAFDAHFLQPLPLGHFVQRHEVVFDR